MSYDEVINEIFDVSGHEPKSTELQLIKLMEEVGEVSEAYLKMIGEKKSHASEAEKQKHFLEELSDVIQICFSILHKENFTEVEIIDMLSHKLVKWKRVSGINM